MHIFVRMTIKKMESALDAFQGRVARRLTGRQPRRGRDRKWFYPSLAGALKEAGVVRARTSVLQRQNTVAQFIATRPILGLCKVAAAAGDTCPTAVVGAVENRLEFGEGKVGSGRGTSGRKRGGDGDTGIRSGSGFGTSPQAGVDCGRHQGGGIPGSQWFQ